MIQLSPGLLSSLCNYHIQVLSTSDPFPTSRPDQSSIALATDAGPLVIKFFPPGKGSETYDHMTNLWQSSFGARRSPPGLPRPIAFIEDQSALVMERLDGAPMVEQMDSGRRRIEEIAAIMVDLHTSDAYPARKRDAKRVVRSLQRKLRDLDGMEAGQYLKHLLARLEDQLPEITNSPDAGLVPSHGDFSPRNIFISARCIALIDWDRFQLADPARDLAYFGAWCWAMDLCTGWHPDWSLGEQLIEIYRSNLPVPGLEKRIGFYRAAGLARIAHGQVCLWKTQEWVPSIMVEALRLLT